MQPLELLTVFIGPLEAGQVAYFVTGSVASIFYGEPRLTHDVDIVVHLSKSDLQKFSSLFPGEQFYCPPDEVIAIETARRPFGHFNLIHHDSGFKADIYPDGDDSLHQWAFSRRKRIDLGSGNALWLAPPEYVILRKLEYFREGGSEKHLEDIRKMLPQIEGGLDDAFLLAELKTRGLSAYWDRARDDFDPK